MARRVHRHTTMNELVLRRAILGAIAATFPVGAGVVACGGSGGPGDAGNDVGNDVPCLCCNLPPPQDYTVTYDVCSALDAGLDGAADAEAGAVEAGAVCYSSCYEAC